jgi:hypothetical protein
VSCPSRFLRKSARHRARNSSRLKGFRDQIVGPVIEASNPRVNFVPAGEHEDGQFGMDPAHLHKCNFAILDGQIQIKNRQVRQFISEGLYSLAAIVDIVHAMPVGLQPSSQK